MRFVVVSFLHANSNIALDHSSFGKTEIIFRLLLLLGQEMYLSLPNNDGFVAKQPHAYAALMYLSLCRLSILLGKELSQKWHLDTTEKPARSFVLRSCINLLVIYGDLVELGELHKGMIHQGRVSGGDEQYVHDCLITAEKHRRRSLSLHCFCFSHNTWSLEKGTTPNPPQWILGAPWH